MSPNIEENMKQYGILEECTFISRKDVSERCVRLKIIRYRTYLKLNF